MTAYRSAVQWAVVSALVSLLVAAAGAAFAQGYPAKPIRIIHHNAAGGPPDTQFRALTPLVTKALGQPLVIENRIGGDGIIGAEAFVRSVPDGYTLFLANQGVVIGNPFIREKLPYDVEDFVPIMLTGEFRSLVIVHPSLAANSMKEVLALAKAKPGAVAWSVGSSSPITTSILYVNWFRKAHGIDFLAVPYKSTTDALNAVVSGQAQLTVYADGLAAKQVQSGKLRAIAAVGDQRSAVMPDVPSLKEQGIDLNVRSFYGLFGLRGTPDPIIRRLNTELRRIVERPEFQEKYVAGLGMVYESFTPEQFGAYLKSQRDDFVKLAALLDLKKE
jgi:tripartite-type tricarboxylate transporter receptor subunit TctC